MHANVVLYDCHSIRSVIPRLFEGTLPVFNLGTNDGKSADPGLAGAWSRQIMAEAAQSWVVNGRFKGGWITRALRQPGQAACMRCRWNCRSRGYMREPDGQWRPENWPPPTIPPTPRRSARHAHEILEAALRLGARLTRTSRRLEMQS